jgi:hypothetical protein
MKRIAPWEVDEELELDLDMKGFTPCCKNATLGCQGDR